MKSLTHILSTRAGFVLGLSILSAGDLACAKTPTRTASARSSVEREAYDYDTMDQLPSKSSQKTSQTSTPASQQGSGRMDSARSTPAAVRKRPDYQNYSAEGYLRQLLGNEQELLDLVSDEYYGLNVRNYRIRSYTFIDSAEASHERKLRLELIRGEQRVMIQISFDERKGITSVRKIDEATLEAAAWEVVRRVVQETNNDSVYGQLDCYADVVSPYFDKGRLTKQEIRTLLRGWRRDYTYYHMKIISFSVDKAKKPNDRADYKVNMMVKVTWKAIGGRYEHSRTYAATYGVRTDDDPKIVSVVYKRR